MALASSRERAHRKGTGPEYTVGISQQCGSDVPSLADLPPWDT